MPSNRISMTCCRLMRCHKADDNPIPDNSYLLSSMYSLTWLCSKPPPPARLPLYGSDGCSLFAQPTSTYRIREDDRRATVTYTVGQSLNQTDSRLQVKACAASPGSCSPCRHHLTGVAIINSLLLFALLALAPPYDFWVYNFVKFF